MMTGGFNYCNGRPCKFTTCVYPSEKHIYNGYLHEWVYDPHRGIVYGLVEDSRGFMHKIGYSDIQLLPWDTIFVKEEQPDES